MSLTKEPHVKTTCEYGVILVLRTRVIWVFESSLAHVSGWGDIVLPLVTNMRFQQIIVNSC